MADSWFNADGLNVEYGRKLARKRNEAHATKNFGDLQELVWDIDFAKLPAGGTLFTTDRNNDGTNDGFNTGDTFIPDQAHIRSVTLYMTDEAAAGGTSITVGTYQVNGTAIDADGLLKPATGITASMGANADLAGDGDQIGTALTQKGYLGLTTVGTFTAGKGRLVITYALGRYV